MQIFSSPTSQQTPQPGAESADAGPLPSLRFTKVTDVFARVLAGLNHGQEQPTRPEAASTAESEVPSSTPPVGDIASQPQTIVETEQPATKTLSQHTPLLEDSNTQVAPGNKPALENSPEDRSLSHDASMGIPNSTVARPSLQENPPGHDSGKPSQVSQPIDGAPFPQNVRAPEAGAVASTPQRISASVQEFAQEGVHPHLALGATSKGTQAVDHSPVASFRPATDPQKQIGWATSFIKHDAAAARSNLGQPVQQIGEGLPRIEARGSTRLKPQVPLQESPLIGRAIAPHDAPAAAHLPAKNIPDALPQIGTQSVPGNSPAALVSDADSEEIVPQLFEPRTPPSRMASSLSMPTQGASTERSSFPRSLAAANIQSIGTAAVTIKDTGGQLDVSLTPEELGRLTIKLDQSAISPSLILMADRPETQELIRRHMDLLHDQLRQLGFGEFEFTFENNSHQPAGKHSEDALASGDQTVAAPNGHPEKAPLTRHLMKLETGLDLRI